MDTLSIIIGSAAVIFGLATAVLRLTRPGMFRKLEAMKKTWGETTGAVMHWIAYTILPILVGSAFIVAGLKGVSPFGP